MRKIQEKAQLILSIMCLLILSSCASNKGVYNYEMVCQGVGSQGTNLIKVYSYARTVNKAIDLSKRNAVHGILFKGLSGGNGCATQPPIVSPTQYEANKAFFDEFFKSDYLQFVSLSSDGTVSPEDRLKVGRNYKIGVVVSVNKMGLRKYLEERNIIQKLGSIF